MLPHLFVCVCFLALKVIHPFIFKLGWALSIFYMTLALPPPPPVHWTKKAQFSFSVSFLLSSYNNNLVNILQDCRQTERGGYRQTVSLFVCGLSPLIHWCLTTSSPPYCSPNSLQVPHFFPDLFFPPCLYSYSPLCENAQMLNVIGCAHTKNVWHSLKHLSSSHTLLYPPAFLTVWNPFTAAPLPFLLFMPFIGFITIHFATSPPNSLLLP